LTLTNLESLRSLTLNDLSQASSISITGNSNLNYLMLPQLEEVNGELTLTGSFSR
jgi:hypothetical protein